MLGPLFGAPERRGFETLLKRRRLGFTREDERGAVKHARTSLVVVSGRLGWLSSSLLAARLLHMAAMLRLTNLMQRQTYCASFLFSSLFA